MDLSKLTAGKNVPEEINVLIEVPHGSSIKYEMDKETGFITVDRFAYTAMEYPANYGFIPQTMAKDGDPMDVLVIASQTLHPGVVIPVRPIGMLEMEDEAGVDTKIIAVPTKKVDPFYATVEDISDIEEPLKNLIKHYFDHYKELEPNKWVKTKAFLDKNAAYDAIKQSMK
jgi:inorganic pyrophosphatase